MTSPKCKTCHGTKISCGDKGLVDCPDCAKSKCVRCNKFIPSFEDSVRGFHFCAIDTLSKAQQCKAKLDAVLQEFGGALRFDQGYLELTVNNRSIPLDFNIEQTGYNGKTEVSDE